MTEFIRVRQNETGHELSVPKSHAEAVGGYEEIDKPAVDSAGRPLPPKYRLTVDEAAPKTPAPKAGSRPTTTDGRQADTKKENV